MAKFESGRGENRGNLPDIGDERRNHRLARREREDGREREENRLGRDQQMSSQERIAYGDYDESKDVVLEVPQVKVDKISLEVDDLLAQVSLNAEVANLIKIDVGARVEGSGVRLVIEGVEAQARLIVRLEDVRSIVETTVTTLAEHPELVEAVAKTVRGPVSRIARGAADTAEHTGEAVQRGAQKFQRQAVRSLAGKAAGKAKDAIPGMGMIGKLSHAIGEARDRLS
jgi:hypothetical protein